MGRARGRGGEYGLGGGVDFTSILSCNLIHSVEMSDSKVETISRLAQWKIENFGPTTTYKRSDPFKIGIWNWYVCIIWWWGWRRRRILKCFWWYSRQLSVEKNRYMYIRLFPEPSRLSKEQPPLARFVLRVTTSGSNRRPYISPSMNILWLFYCFCCYYFLSLLNSICAQ